MSVRTLLLASVLVLVLTPVLLAERPNLGPDMLKGEATHVVVGTVKAVYARVLKTGRQGPGTEETHYLVEVEVDTVEKGEGLKKKDLVYVRCWQITKNGPNITPGPGGHGPIPKEGNRVRAYVARGPYGPMRQTDQGTMAVYPNGFQILPTR